MAVRDRQVKLTLRQALAQLAAVADDAGRLCRVARHLSPNEAALLRDEFERLSSELNERTILGQARVIPGGSVAGVSMV